MKPRFKKSDKIGDVIREICAEKGVEYNPNWTPVDACREVFGVIIEPCGNKGWFKLKELIVEEYGVED